MATLYTPTDGRLTSQNSLSGPLTGGEVMWIVSPGNAAAGNTYQVSTGLLAEFFAAVPFLNTEIILSVASAASPYMVEGDDATILFNKFAGAPSYAVLPLASSIIYQQPVLFKDIKGDAFTNNITITFSNGELCDGQSTILITENYGWAQITPVPDGSAWYLVA